MSSRWPDSDKKWSQRDTSRTRNCVFPTDSRVVSQDVAGTDLPALVSAISSAQYGDGVATMEDQVTAERVNRVFHTID
jgi:hypothetical protein